jgi:hypothetical protein
MAVCEPCHHTIHDGSDRYDQYDPDVGFFAVTTPVDKTKLPSRDGWKIRLKMSNCGQDTLCDNCPHGPYYIYFRYTGDGEKEEEYGGTVPEHAILSQKTLEDFTE